MSKKWILFPVLFFLPACSTAQSLIKRIQVLSQNETIDNLKIGDKIVLEPKTLTYEDQSKVVKGQIILPDGTSKAGDSFIIEMPGIYTVNYRAFFGTHEVSVSQFYHCHRTSGNFFLSSNKDNPAQTGEYSHPIKSETIQGAKLLLDTKTVFTYDGEIDFSSFSFEESFLDFVIDTSKQSTSDIETFTVRLTDTENSNNYVDITVTDSGPVDDDGKGCYLLAGSNNQFKTGFENGRNGTMHTSKYGANVGVSFRDLPDKGARLAHLYFDYVNKALYASPMMNSDIKDIITDLDDKDIYGSGIWEGFTNGKATLSIFANSLLSSSATLIVSKVAGQDLRPLDFVDVDAPTINIDFNGQSSINVPMASVNKPYRIYDAIISDNYDRHLSYSTYVTYFDQTNNKKKDISVIDGYFTPKQEGKYTITYVAKDHSNNYVEKTVEVNAINDPQSMVINYDVDTIDVDLYSKANLPSINEIKGKISGGSGKPSVTRSVFDSENNPIEIEGDSLIPDKIGQYKVYYQATDYINNVLTYLLKINVNNPGHPVFIEEFSLPRVLIKGHTYTLPSYQGAEVVNDKTVYIESKIYVNDVLLEGNSFVASNECEIKYQLTGQTGEKIEKETIAVINCGNPINLANYFYGGFDATVNKNDVTLSKNSGDASALFASILPYDNPYVKFAINRDEIHFDELVIKFSDYLNQHNSVSFHLKFKNGQTYLSIGNSTNEFLFSSVMENANESFAIDLYNSTRVLRDVLHKEVEIIKYNDQGEPFTGFSGGVYLDISMNGIKQQSSVKILTISNQILGDIGMNKYVDFASPVIIFNKTFINEQTYGEDSYVPSVEVFDVLSDASAKVTVKAPDGTFILRDKNALEDHSFILNQFGSYLVTYRGVDEEGNAVSYPRMITVYDFVAPELTITGKLKATYSLNASISIPSYQVKDNLNDYTLDIFLTMPDNQERLLLVDRNGEITSYLEKDNAIYNSSFKVNSTTFRAEQRGHYILRFVAYDSDFNKVEKELHFDVK